MSQRLGGKDCRPRISYQPGFKASEKPCEGRDLDAAGVRIPCEHNGFIGVPFKDLPREGRSLNGSSIETGVRYKPADLDGPNSKLMRDTRKPWKAPRLAAEGKPFEPELADVGSFVSFEQGGLVHRGQVWAKAPRPKNVWVVTETGHAECVSVDDLAASPPHDLTPTREATQ